MQPHERLPYSPIVERKPLRFPDGVRLVLWPVMSLEVWDIARPDGRIRFDGKYYSSLTLAAKTAINRTVNGWWFWKVKRGGVWERLIKIRKAGTPLYRS